MALERPEYYVTTSQIDHERVQVRWADQLLAEREGPRHGITDKLPLALTTYWVWAALKRDGHPVGEFQAFYQDADLDVEPIKDVDPVPPSEPAPAG